MSSKFHLNVYMSCKFHLNMYISSKLHLNFIYGGYNFLPKRT